MNAHALAVLEFGAALAGVGARAASPLGRAAVEARLPSVDVEVVRRELARVSETQRFLTEHPGWGMPTVPDAVRALERLPVPGSVLEPHELVAIGILLASGRALAHELAGEEGAPALAALRELLYEDEQTEAVIARSVDEEGNVLDTASRELKRIRGELRRAHSRIVARLEGYMRSLPDRVAVADASVTIRDGRYVIPVRREGKGGGGRDRARRIRHRRDAVRGAAGGDRADERAARPGARAAAGDPPRPGRAHRAAGTGGRSARRIARSAGGLRFAPRTRACGA